MHGHCLNSQKITCVTEQELSVLQALYWNRESGARCFTGRGRKDGEKEQFSEAARGSAQQSLEFISHLLVPAQMLPPLDHPSGLEHQQYFQCLIWAFHIFLPQLSWDSLLGSEKGDYISRHSILLSVPHRSFPGQPQRGEKTDEIIRTLGKL